MVWDVRGREGGDVMVCVVITHVHVVLLVVILYYHVHVWGGDDWSVWNT